MKTLIICFILICFQVSAKAQDTISAVQAQKYMGKKVILCDRVNYGRHININTKEPVILYVGPDHPNHHLTLYIPYHRVRRFSFDPEKKMINKRFCVTGKISSFENKPAIYIKRESQVNEEEVNSYIYNYDEKIDNSKNKN